MDDLKIRFMLALVNGRGGTITDDEISQVEQRAIQLARAACPEQAQPGVSESAGALTERDRAVLEIFQRFAPSFHAGIRASQWKALCVRENVGGRAAWESSTHRLLAHGLVRKAGTRFVLANSDAA